MGDRSNIVVKEGAHKLYLYGHWAGFDGAVKAVASGLKRGAERHNDAPYLARILLDDFKGTNRETTSFGIWPSLGDNEHPLVVVDIDKQQVYTTNEDGEPDGVINPTAFSAFDYTAAGDAIVARDAEYYR